MWDVHALVEQGAVLGRSRRDGRGEGVLIVQTYSREHSNWVALRCGGLALLHIVEQGPLPIRRRRGVVLETAAARWREVCTRPRRDLVPPDLLVVS